MNKINFLIFVALAEGELLHSTSLSLTLNRPCLYLLPPTLEHLEKEFCSFDIPSVETQPVTYKLIFSNFMKCKPIDRLMGVVVKSKAKHDGMLFV